MRKKHSLESFVSTINQPNLDLHYLDFYPTALATHILSLLPDPARLALRLVSHAMKAWTENSPSPLQHLRLTFPLSHYALKDLAPFQEFSRQCTHLTVKLEPSKIELPEPRDETESPLKLTHLTALTDLVIVAPWCDEFFPLEAFRIALQGAMAENLRCVTISPVTMEAIEALRWGPFTSYRQTDWAGAKVWMGLTRLELGLKPWWEDIYVDVDGATQSKRLRQPVYRWRTGVKLLYDWLASFASSEKIETLKIWWYEHEGTNPILLHSVAAKEREPEWHSMKGITWRGLRYLWLSGCVVGMEDIIEIRRRCPDLEEMWIENQWIVQEIKGTREYIEGELWMKVKLGFDNEGAEKTKAKKGPVDQGEQEEEEDEYSDIGPSELNVIEVEKRYVEEVDPRNYEKFGGVNDYSIEVPLILDV